MMFKQDNLIIRIHEAELVDGVEAKEGIHEAVPTIVRAGVGLDPDTGLWLIRVNPHLAIRMLSLITDAERLQIKVYMIKGQKIIKKASTATYRPNQRPLDLFKECPDFIY